MWLLSQPEELNDYFFSYVPILEWLVMFAKPFFLALVKFLKQAASHYIDCFVLFNPDS